MITLVWKRARADDPRVDVEQAIAAGWPLLPGMAIFPVREKRPMRKGWAQYASADPAERQQLARDFPERTGWAVAVKPSGILVVDIDAKPDRDGRASWVEMFADHPDLTTGAGIMVHSASGGMHLWYSFPWGWDSPAGQRIGNTSDVAAPGIDIRSGRGESGGLAVFAGADRTAQVLGPLTPPPAPLLRRIAEPARPETPPPARRAATGSPVGAKHYALSGLLGAASKIADAKPGGRNGLLNWAAHGPGRDAMAKGWPRETVESILTEAAQAAGLGAAETTATIRSGLGA